MGVTAVSISPMLAMAAMPGVGLTGIYGAVLVGGLFGLCMAPFVKYVLRFFPAVVTGTIITMIGVVLMRVGVNWAGGGAAAADFGAPGYLLVAGLVLVVILFIIKFTSGFLQNVAVLIGIAAGYVVTIALGWTDFSGIQDEPLVRIVLPLQFGAAAILARAVSDDVPRHDDRLHRGDRHVPRAGNDDGAERSDRTTSNAACAPILWAP